jgi:endonuclease/exonuclease/phosphatase family metal-dependent hydrolase
MNKARCLWCRASLLLAVPLVWSCTPADESTEQQRTGPVSTVTGTLENPKIDEASGLARSQRTDDLLWVISDDGPPVLHAISTTGAQLGRVKVSDAKNSDWEDLASFSLDGVPYLLVASVGDNDSKRKTVKLYVIEEPDPTQSKVKIAWRIEFRYEDGPRDAEAVAVDIDNERVLILTKRDIPAALYAVPLIPTSNKKQQATRLGVIDSLPQPRRRDVEFAPKTDNWYWQPTGMDISDDGDAAVILTYGGIYLYRKKVDENWLNALRRRPVVAATSRNREAESVAFNSDGNAIFVTLEWRKAPLIRIDFEAPEPGLADGNPSQVPAVTIMTFNVQNLFDNIDDPGKDDKAYLPIAVKQAEAHVAACNQIEVESWRNECLHLDWSDEAIDHKLSVLAETIRQVNDGRGADIIALQEVENASILERLRKEYLADSGYLPAVLIEGTDVRGIDVAFLSRLPLAGEPRLHPLVLEDFPDRAGDTRGVVEATFELPDGSLLTGFSVHFPAPFHPTEMRVLAYDHLNSILSELPPDRSVFAAGDFNTTSSEDSRQKMLERYVRPFWTVAHDTCEGCPGTHYYSRDDTWSFLDMILYSPARGEKATWQIRADSVQIANRNIDQVTKDGTPQRYNAAMRAGVSDHWPIITTIESLKKQ